MDDLERTTLKALRDFFLARTGEDLAIACAKLAKDGYDGTSLLRISAMDWESAEFTFNKLFVGPMALQAPPYASYYLEPEQQLMGESTLRVRRLYEMAGLVSPEIGRLPCDHLGVELDAALGILALAERTEAEEPRLLWQYFLHGHLEVWLPLFLHQARNAEAGHPAVDLVLMRLEAWLNKKLREEEGHDR
jgi:putative dimethyl sulfoxide reductase chaperone